MDLSLGPDCLPTSAQTGSFLPGWEIALPWDFSAWGRVFRVRFSVKNLQLPIFLRTQTWTTQSPVRSREGSREGQRRLPEAPAQLWGHPWHPPV